MFVGRNSKAADFENWTFVGGETKWKNTELSFHNANFFRSQQSWFLNHTQVTVDFATHRKFFLGLGYKQEYVDFEERWRREYRPFIRGFYRNEFSLFQFINKNQWEWRFMDGDIIQRYRNMVMLRYQRMKRVTPFVMTEAFFYVKHFNYYRQRFFMGAAIPFKNIEVELFLGYEYTETLGTWNKKMMLGTGVSYAF